eukprot:m.123691 g.123691  ORF g.123691 m.123691 type:complete len:1041 (+) comp9654_c0_seq4:168-3290(+)
MAPPASAASAAASAVEAQARQAPQAPLLGVAVSALVLPTANAADCAIRISLHNAANSGPLAVECSPDFPAPPPGTSNRPQLAFSCALPASGAAVAPGAAALLVEVVDRVQPDNPVLAADTVDVAQYVAGESSAQRFLSGSLLPGGPAVRLGRYLLNLDVSHLADSALSLSPLSPLSVAAAGGEVAAAPPALSSKRTKPSPSHQLNIPATIPEAAETSSLRAQETRGAVENAPRSLLSLPTAVEGVLCRGEESKVPSKRSAAAMGARTTRKPKPDEWRIDLVLHSAADIPMLPGEKPSQPNMTVSTTGAPSTYHHQQHQGHQQQQATAKALAVTTRPVWHVPMQFFVHKDQFQREDAELRFCIADSASEIELVSFALPLRFLRAFHQYNLEIIYQNLYGPHTRVYSTLTATPPSTLETEATVSLELCVGSISGFALRPSMEPPNILVCRRICDIQGHASTLQTAPRTIPLARRFWTITLPDSTSDDFEPPTNEAFYSQICALDMRGTEIQANHKFVFTDPLLDLFRTNSGLVLELYGTKPESALAWMPAPQSLLGYVVVPLDAELLGELGNRPSKSLTLPHIPLSVILDQDARATVDITVQLCGTAADDMSPGTELANLLEAELPSEDQAIPLDVFDGSSPEDVLGLTDEANLFEVVHAKRQGTLADLRTVGDNDSDGTPPTITRLARPIPEKMTIEEQQEYINKAMAQIDVRAQAVKRMSSDLLDLRAQAVKLNKELASSKRAAAEALAASQVAVDESDFAHISTEALITGYVDLANAYFDEVARLEEHRKRIEMLQNSLIQKNEAERKHLQMERRHRKELAIVQTMQERTQRSKKYETLCRQQEQVIHRFESVLGNKHPPLVDSDTLFGSPAYTALLRRNLELWKVLHSLYSTEVTSHRPPAPSKAEAAQMQNLQIELDDLQTKGQRLEAATRQSASLAKQQASLSALMKKEVGEQHIRALEQELSTMRRVHEREIANLRATLLEKTAHLSVKARTSPHTTATPLGSLRAMPRDSGLRQSQPRRKSSSVSPIVPRHRFQ